MMRGKPERCSKSSVAIHKPIVVSRLSQPIYRVDLPDGRAVALQGTITFRQATKGSKGQPDRELPVLPLVRDALLEAWNHRRDETPWVIWNWRDSKRPTRYDSMWSELRKLERRANVTRVQGRAFHAFRRSLATALVEELGLTQASRWIGDTPDVISRRYVKPGQQAQAQAAAYLVTLWQPGEISKPGQVSGAQQQPDRNPGRGASVTGPGNLAMTGTYGTGPAGLEPATPGFGDRCSTT